jgi:hypothetical protein
MEKSHLIHVLKTLDKKETREFRKWLLSPAHNLRHDVVDLYDYLMSGNHLLSEKALDKNRVFKSVYPKHKFDDAELRQVNHFLFKALENFLLYNELLTDEVRSHTILSKVYRQRQLPKLFQKTISTGQKIQNEQPFRNHQYFENEYFLQFELYTYLSGLGRSVPLNLQDVSNANDVAYLANKLQLSCIMLSHQAVFKTEYKMSLLDEVIHLVESNPYYLGVPAISIYYHSYKAISENGNVSHFYRLKELLEKNGSLFPTHELRVIYLLTINYCIGRINAGESAFVRESYELYKSGFTRKIFLENGILSRFTFSNAISTGLNLKEYKWVERFIEEYKPYLDELHRENFVHFNVARLHFEKKEYDRAMKLFAQSDYDDILMSLNAKTMLLKMYYELDEINALESLLGSMRTYLQRKKVLGYHKSNYQSIIHFTKKLLKLPPYASDQHAKLKKELTEATPLTERKWLLDQLERI